MIGFLGPPPPEMLEKSEYANEFFGEDGKSSVFSCLYIKFF